MALLCGPPHGPDPKPTHKPGDLRAVLMASGAMRRWIFQHGQDGLGGFIVGLCRCLHYSEFSMSATTNQFCPSRGLKLHWRLETVSHKW
eukprot:4872645-Amphidinium_carterae.2